MKHFKKVLIVDDNYNAASSVSEFLKTEGYETKIVKNSRDALDLFAQERFGIILLDIKSSAVKEIGVLDKIKQLSPEAIVIVFTHEKDQEQQREIAEKGVFGVIYKPDYLSYVERVLKRRRQGKQGK